MKAFAKGLWIILLIVSLLLFACSLYVIFNRIDNDSVKAGEFTVINYCDESLGIKKGSAVAVKKTDIAEDDPIVYKTDDGIKLSFVKSIENEDIYLKNANGEIEDLISMDEQYIGKVDVYIPLIGMFIVFMNGIYGYTAAAILFLIAVLSAIMAFAKNKDKNRIKNIEKADNGITESFEREDSESLLKVSGDNADEPFHAFFSVNYTVDEVKSLIKMILDSECERYKFCFLGADAEEIYKAVIGYAEACGEQDFSYQSKDVVFIVETKREFAIKVCSIIIKIYKSISENSENAEDAGRKE